MTNPRLPDELSTIRLSSTNGIVSNMPVVNAGELYRTLYALYNRELHRSSIVPLNSTRLVTSLLVKLIGRPLEQITTFTLPEDDHIQCRDGYVGVDVLIVVSYHHALTSDNEYMFSARQVSRSAVKYNQTHSVSKSGVFIPCIKEESFRSVLAQLRSHGQSVYIDWRDSGLDDALLDETGETHEPS